jgi:integrase
LLLSCVTKVAHGKNPQDIKRTARNANSVTVTWCYEQFLKRYLQPHLRTWKIYDRRLTVDVLPALGNKDIREVKKADIIKIIDGITDRNAPILANRVLQYMSKFFKWCVGRGYIEHNPTINIPKPAREHSRERVLNLAEARSIYHAAECLGLINCAFVRLLMLTGQRRSEISNLECSELKDDRIEIGSHRSKNGKPITTPLTDEAKAVLATLPRNNGVFVFSTTDGHRPIGNFSRIKERLSKTSGVADWTFHDFRRSMATSMAKRNKTRFDIITTLNHTDTSVTGIYEWSNHSDVKLCVLSDWSRLLY